MSPGQTTCSSLRCYAYHSDQQQQTSYWQLQIKKQRTISKPVNREIVSRVPSLLERKVIVYNCDSTINKHYGRKNNIHGSLRSGNMIGVISFAHVVWVTLLLIEFARNKNEVALSITKAQTYFLQSNTVGN